MASHASYRNGWSSGGEEEDPNDREGQDREEGSRIGRTLRSTIVCVRPDPQSPPHGPSQSPPPKVEKLNEDRNEDSRRVEHLNIDRDTVSHHRDIQKGRNAVRVVKDSELERRSSPGIEKGAIRFSRSSRERDSDVPIAVVRDSDRVRATQRDPPQTDRLRDIDEGVRGETSKRENRALPDEDHVRDQDHRRFTGDMKGKEKRNTRDNMLASACSRERSWHREDGPYSQNDRGHSTSNLRRDRCDSHSSHERDANSPRYSSRNEGLRSSMRDEVKESLKSKDFRGERWKEIDRGRGDASLPELYSIHKATVHSVRPFGLFVRLDGYRNHGLVHISQVSEYEVTKRDDADAVKVEALSSVAAEGESVWVKVISVKTEEDGSVKVGCSLKYVSQGDGRDLDPNNLQLEKLQTKPAWQAPKKLQLEAVYNVTCTRCGGHGHLKKECYSTGEKKYDLLQDGDEIHDGGGNFKDKGVVASNPVSVGQTSKPPSGPVGRGRAMVQPAWMKHGVGVGGDADKSIGRRTSAGSSDVHKDEPALPEKVTTVREALAVIARLKEEKHRKKDEKRERKYHKRWRKHSSKDGKRDKHRKRHSSEDDYKSRKKHRV